MLPESWSVTGPVTAQGAGERSFTGMLAHMLHKIGSTSGGIRTMMTCEGFTSTAGVDGAPVVTYTRHAVPWFSNPSHCHPDTPATTTLQKTHQQLVWLNNSLSHMTQHIYTHTKTHTHTLTPHTNISPLTFTSPFVHTFVVQPLPLSNPSPSFLHHLKHTVVTWTLKDTDKCL